ncbi:UbiA prenyltransferase [Hypoxylon sp. NC0597]|nr:UbiA prenyltransferase [Hypoxylon sp. NC0597]
MNSKTKNEKSQSAEEASAFQNNALAQQYGGGHVGGWVGRLPSSWVPYVQLARLSPPAALFLIYFPHFFGVMLAAIIQRSPVSQVLRASFIMLGGSFFFSNAAHGWNDLIDAPIDKSIARTSKRPIPRGAITPRAAFIFTATQAIGAASFLLLMPEGSAIYAIPNIIGTCYYPWAKRHTNFAQLVLGFCLAWGIIMGSCAMGLKPFTGEPFGGGDESGWKQLFWAEPSTACLFLASILWTVIYDSIYAHQDIKDDIKVGLKSIAVLFKDQTKPLLWLLLGCMVTLLYTCGNLLNMGIPFYVIAAGGSLLSLGAMIANVNLKESASCWWWFRYGFWLAGGAIAGGLLSEYVLIGPSF